MGQLKELKALQKENERLCKAASDLTLDKLILQEGSPRKLLSPKLRRLCIDHVWSYDFVHHRTEDGKAFSTLTL